MGFLTTLYRATFCSGPKRLLLELFDAAPDATTGIVLQEIGLPYGKVTLYRWWRTDECAFCSVMETRSVGSARPCDTTKVTQRPATRFDELLSLIETADTPPLENYSGNLRDGIVYCISWGTKKHLRALGVQNPIRESPYCYLIQQLKANAWTDN